MSSYLITAIVISELISLILIYRLWLSGDYLFVKIIGTALALIPCVGPLLMLFATDNTPVQPAHLKNYEPRGWLSFHWGAQRKLLEDDIAEAEQKQSEYQDSSDT